jgi:hypothetical protein
MQVPNTPPMWRLSMKGVKERKSPNQWKKYALTWTCSPLVLRLHLRVKKARRLSPLNKELLDLKVRLWCSSGIEKQASVVSVFTMVAWPAHPPLTDLLLIPLLRTNSWWWRRGRARWWRRWRQWVKPLEDLPHIFFVLNDKGGEILIKAWRLNSVCFSFCSV